MAWERCVRGRHGVGAAREKSVQRRGGVREADVGDSCRKELGGRKKNRKGRIRE